MATGAAELWVYLKLKDQASKALATGFKAAGMSVVGLTASVVAAGAALTKLAIDAAPAAGIKAAFEGITAGNVKMLDQLRKSSNFMVNDTELMRSYNQAAQLVSKTFADQLPEAMQYLQKVSAATGQSMDYMVNSLILGVGRLSPKILDNLAIQVSEAEATQRAAKMFGVEADALSKAQQQAGMMNVAMEKLKANTAAMPGMANSAAAGFAQLTTALSNLKTNIGLALLPAFQQILPAITNMVNQASPILVGLAQKISDAFIRNMPQILASVKAITQAVGQAWNWIAGVTATAWPYIYAIIKGVLDTVQGLIKVGGQVMQGNWSGAFNSLAQTAATALGNVVGIVQHALQDIADAHPSIFNWIQQQWQTVSNVVGKVFEAIGAAWSRFAEWFWTTAEWLGKAWDTVTGWMGNSNSHVEQSIQDLRATMGNYVANVGTYMENIVGYVNQGTTAFNRYYAAASGDRTASGVPWFGRGTPETPTAKPPTFTPPAMPDFDTAADATVAAAKEKAGEVTADIASLMDKMLKDIASIYKTLGEKLPDVVTPVRTFMDRLWQVASAVAGWTNTGGPEMRAFVDWIAKDLEPMWTKWADSMQPIVSIIQSVASISETASTAMADMKASVTGFMDRALSIGREAGGWMNQHAALIIPFVDWLDTDLKDLWQKWADSLKPLVELLGLGKASADTLAEAAKEQKATVANMFDRLYTIMEETRRIVNGNAILKAAILAYKEWVAPTIKEWNETLADLGNLLTLGRGMAESTGEKLPAMNVTVATLFSRLDEMMTATRDWVRAKGPDFSASMDAFKAEIAPTLQTWLDGLSPLAGLFDMGLGMMALMGTKVKKLVVPVTGFLSKLANIGYLAQRWVESQGADFPARMEALRDQLTAALVPMQEALAPVAAIMDLLESFMVEDDKKKAWKANVNSVFESVITPAMDAVKQGLASIATTLGDPTAIQSAYDSAFSLGAVVGGGLAAGLTSMLGAVSAAAAALIAAGSVGGGGSIGAVFGNDVPYPYPQIPMMQTGGIVPYTGLYRMHEGELVVPAEDAPGYEPVERPRRAGDISINIGNLYGTDREAAEKMGGFILRELQRQGVVLRA